MPTAACAKTLPKRSSLARRSIGASLDLTIKRSSARLVLITVWVGGVRVCGFRFGDRVPLNDPTVASCNIQRERLPGQEEARGVSFSTRRALDSCSGSIEGARFGHSLSPNLSQYGV